MLFTGLGRSVLGKTVPSVSSTQDLGHHFSQYRPPGQWKTYIYCSNNNLSTALHKVNTNLELFWSWCRNLYLQARIILMNTEININQMRHFSKCYSNEVSFQCFSTNQHWLRPQKGIGWLLLRVQLAVEKLPRFVMDSWCTSKEMAKLQYPKLWKSCKSLTWFNTSNWKVCSWKEVAFFFGYYFSLPHFSSCYFAIQRTWKCSLY